MTSRNRLSTVETAQRLNVARSHVTWLVNQGYLKAERVDNRLRISEAGVRAYAVERSRWISIQAAGDLLGCGRRQVENMLADGRLVGRPRLDALKWGQAWLKRNVG